MDRRKVWACTVIFCLVCVLSLGVLAAWQYDKRDMQVSVTIEKHRITGIYGGSDRHLSLVRHDTMHRDYVELAKSTPIWYVDDRVTAYAFFGSEPAAFITAEACDAHGNRQTLPCAQNSIDLPGESGEYTIGVWAQKGRDTALYAFRIHVVGE